MRRHYLFAENGKEHSFGENGDNLLQLWHKRRNDMLMGDDSVHEGEANASVRRELMQLWDLAKPIDCSALSRENYINFFARVAKALIFSLNSDAIAIAVAQRDWEYDLEDSSTEFVTTSSLLDNRRLMPDQFREAVLQLAEIILPVESSVGVFATFFKALRNSIAELVLPSFNTGLELDENNSSEPFERFTLRPFNQITKIAITAFLQKSPPLIDAIHKVQGVPPPDLRAMSLKQLLVCYNPRKFSLSRAFSCIEATTDTEKRTVSASVANSAKVSVSGHHVDDMEAAQRVHLELVGQIGVGATPVRNRKLYRQIDTHSNFEDAVTIALTHFPALNVSVVGPPGCGKTRLARILARILRLRYLSLDEALQRAFDRKLRLRQRGDVVSTHAEGGDANVTTNEHVDNGDDEMDRVFRDEDFDALCAGQAVARNTALALLRIEAVRSILAGVGVILDDVYPSELAARNDNDSTVTVDHLVALTALPSEVECQLKVSEIAPVSGCLYSARELGILKATSLDELASQGFADSLLLPRDPKIRAQEGVESSEVVQANVDTNNEENLEANDRTIEGSSLVSLKDIGLSIKSKSVERNEIAPPIEPTLPIGSLSMAKVGQGYREYLKRIQRELLQRQVEYKTSVESTYHLVVILANQSFSAIRDHCIQAIMGSSLGLSRFSVSREACVVNLPKDLKGVGRSEQVKWLLYGDWNPLFSAEAPESFARLPRRDPHRRLLSKWRDFCPVLSTTVKTLSLGDPEFAACYSGRVYLLSSQDARRSFCAHPQHYLRQDIPFPSTYRNIWFITPGADVTLTPSYIETLEKGLHVQTVSPLKLLEFSSPASLNALLTSGEIVSSVEAAAVAAEAAKALVATSNSSSRWMLTDLPLTRAVATALLEHGVTPDIILLLDKDMAAAQEESEYKTAEANGALALLRRRQYETDVASADEVSQAFDCEPRVITCPLFCQPSDTLAAINRALNPLAPRLDRVEEGEMPQLVDRYDPAMIFASPVPEKPEERTTESIHMTDVEMESKAQAEMRHRALESQGVCGRFCPVSWRTRGLLIPGLPSTVCSFRQKFFAFASDSERRVFERNPVAFVSDEPCPTTNFVPCVLLLGVRGSEIEQIAAALASLRVEQRHSGVDYVKVDMTVVANNATRNQQLEELKPEEARQTPEEVYVRSLQHELQRQESTQKKAIVQVIAGIGFDDSRIPSEAILEACFKNDFFPALVVPLTASEDGVVSRLLTRWAADLQVRRPKLALTRKKETDVGAEDEADDEQLTDIDVAKEEESSRLHEQFTDDQTALDEAITRIRARSIKICDPVDAIRSTRQVVKHVKGIVDEFMAGREALFERCQVLNMTGDETLQLLASGEVLVGKHGFVCPVTGRAPSVFHSSTKVEAVVYRDQLYFPQSREALQAFLACPFKYVNKANQTPTHQSTCCVVGAPFSGTTQVAQELARTLGLIYVSPSCAIDWVLQCQGGSTLRSRLLEIKEQHCDPLTKPAIVHEAICARLHSSECQTRGWVLDGYLVQAHELQRSFPNSNEVNATVQRIQPDMLFVLERSFANVWQEHQTNVNQSVLRLAFAKWHTFRLELIDIWTRRYTGFHVRQLDTTNTSLWHVVAQAQALLNEQRMLASDHAKALACNQAARSVGVVRTHQELQARQHSFYQTFCPVELRIGRYANSCQSNRRLCVDFQSLTFWLGSTQNLEQFVASPESFLAYSPNQTLNMQEDKSWPTQKEVEREAQLLVAKTPTSASYVSLLTVPDCNIPEMKGYCPVTFASSLGTRDWSALCLGSVFFRASYCSKVYYFVSEEARRQFCAEPLKYISQSLPVKLPPQVTLAKSYPGQQEQQFGAALNEVLLAVGNERPKFPQISTRASACVYLALSLKAMQRRNQLKITPDVHALPNEEEYNEEYHERQTRRAKQNEEEALKTRDAFVSDCRLGIKLKATSTLTHPSCGSGAMGARNMRAAQIARNDKKSKDFLDCEDVELLCQRFDAIVNGSAGNDKALLVDPHIVRMHARAAFLEYTKKITIK